MAEELLSTNEAARQLGISRATLYQWVARSNTGALVIRGQPFSINYFQGGRNGQGRIKIEVGEIDRLKEAMRVRPAIPRQRRPPKRRQHFPGIHVELGDVAD